MEFRPAIPAAGASLRLSKMGLLVDPGDRVANGSSLHSVDSTGGVLFSSAHGGTLAAAASAFRCDSAVHIARFTLPLTTRCRDHRCHARPQPRRRPGRGGKTLPLSCVLPLPSRLRQCLGLADPQGAQGRDLNLWNFPTQRDPTEVRSPGTQTHHTSRCDAQQMSWCDEFELV